MFHSPEPDSMISVLYVDDEPDLLEMSRVFREIAGTYMWIPRYPQKTRCRRWFTAGTTVIVADYMMPGSDGIAFPEGNPAPVRHHSVHPLHR
jgi:response regulator RpfG family c-di-GMP phosphodiesterase